jgi:hypothetical protein
LPLQREQLYNIFVIISSYPAVAIDDTGNIKITRCTCKASAGGRCAHVACTLYLIEELKFGLEPKINRPCTSKPQTWGKGKTKDKDPKPFHETGGYGKKMRPDSVINIDPRPPSMRKTTDSEWNYFHLSHQTFKKEPNWTGITEVIYEEYSLTDDRKQLLSLLKDDFLESLKSVQHSLSAPSNAFYSDCIPVDGTEEQSDSENWFKERSIRITASIFLEFSKNPASIINRHLWRQGPDLSRVVAIKWGRDHEKDAILAYEMTYGKTTKCGFFISKTKPFIGASPDALRSQVVIEVKCPYVLKDHLPSDLEKLKPTQKSAFFCKMQNGTLMLKKNHSYYWQCQCQMFVTGFHKTHFVV